MGDLIKKEIAKKSETGIIIQTCIKSFVYGKFPPFLFAQQSLLLTFIFTVDDQIIIDLVTKEVKDCEEQGKSWIL